MSDVLLVSDPLGPRGVEFEPEIIGGVVTMTDDFTTAVHLSFFGGDERDDGSPGSSEKYWGNLLETEPEFVLVSRLQFELRNSPLSSGSIRRIEAAAAADLAWFVSSGIASSVEDIRATIPAVGELLLTGSILALGKESAFKFVSSWQAGVGAETHPAGIIAPPVPTPATGSSVVFNEANSIEGAGAAVLGFANEWSLMVWAKASGASLNSNFARIDSAANLSRIRFRQLGETGIRVQLDDDSGTIFKDWNFENALPDGEWAHLVLTWDGVTLRLACNSVDRFPVLKTTDITLIMDDDPRTIEFSPSENWAGTIHSGAVWSSVLSADEISRIYNAGKTGVDLSVDSPLYTSSATLQHWYQLGADPAQIGLDYGNGTAHDLTALVNLTANDITADVPGGD